MTISEQIKVLCVRSNISVAELARRLGTTPQNLNGKLHSVHGNHAGEVCR